MKYPKFVKKQNRKSMYVSLQTSYLGSITKVGSKLKLVYIKMSFYWIAVLLNIANKQPPN